MVLFNNKGRINSPASDWSKTDAALLNIENQASKTKTKIRIGNYWDGGECKWDALVELKDGTQSQYMAASFSILLRILSKEIKE